MPSGPSYSTERDVKLAMREDPWVEEEANL